jgi:hypothetical protein
VKRRLHSGEGWQEAYGQGEVGGRDQPAVARRYFAARSKPCGQGGSFVARPSLTTDIRATFQRKIQLEYSQHAAHVIAQPLVIRNGSP